jgi:hypothetical protein
MSRACTTPWPADGRHTGGLFGHATPGPWYGAYREDWHLRHSEACAAGELEIGHFRWVPYATWLRATIPAVLKRRLCRVVFNCLRADYARRQQSDPA